MTLNAMQHLVLVQSQVLGPRLYEGMAIAIQDADRRAQGLQHAKYPHLRPMLTRAVAREYLEQEGLPAPWRVDGNPSLMGQLYLTSDDLALTLRVLKERRRSYPGGVPVAGRNPARRSAWQAPLPLDVPDDDEPPLCELLLLWDYSRGDGDRSGFTLRIVHTVEAGVYGRGVRCDLDLAVQPGGTIFTNLAFTGNDDHEDFFVEVDSRENADAE